jgi:peptidoglycan/xylan/chitin deacetylase (PgdA/CDA1 family)
MYLIALSATITISSVLTWVVGGASPWIGVSVTLLGHGILAIGVFHPRSSLLCPTFTGWGDLVTDTDSLPIALTFDDGPDPTVTPLVLDVLRAHGIHATFFLIGNKVERHPELAARIIAEGHEIGNHSHAHPRHIYLWSGEAVARDAARAQGAINAATGRSPTLYRPPVGFRSLGMAHAMRRLELTLVNFTVRSRDTVDRDPDRITRRVIAGARPGGIILLHDGSDRGATPDRAATLEALPKIIEQLGAANYRFVTVSGLRKK